MFTSCFLEFEADKARTFYTPPGTEDQLYDLKAACFSTDIHNKAERINTVKKDILTNSHRPSPSGSIQEKRITSDLNSEKEAKLDNYIQALLSASNQEHQRNQEAMLYQGFVDLKLTDRTYKT